MNSNPERKSLTEKKYWAFISYSSKDRKWGQWLHRRLENYPIPEQFQGTQMFDGAILGKSLRPIFRDRDELAGSADLGPSIQRALRESRYLIVLCSKNSAKSEWVNKEIEDFKALGMEKQILALILDGEPNASSTAGVPDELECFPPALRHPSEPLAGDLRKEGDGKERGFLKILAGAAQLDFDSLYRRHERNQRKKRLALASLATLVISALAALSSFAFLQKKEAVTQRGVAETNERIAKENEKIAQTQQGIAKRQSAEAKVSLSNKLLEQGLSSLAKGMIEEGLASLVGSLEAWPANPYSRDRLLFELSHRPWLVPSESTVIPFDFLLDQLPPVGNGVEFTSEIAFGPLPASGGVALIESLNFHDNDTNEMKITRRESVWGSGGWKTGKTENEDGDEQPQFEYTTDLANGWKMISEPVEAPKGCWDVVVQNHQGEPVPFRTPSFDGVSFSPVSPHGVPALSPDGNSIAIVGLQTASAIGDEEEDKGYNPDGEAHVTIYDSRSLIQVGNYDFTFAVAEDADIIRVWWSGKRLGIHTRQENRRMDRFDWIDFSSEEARFLAKNVAIKSDLWFFDGAKIFLLGKFMAPDGKLEWRMEVSELIPPVSFGQGADQRKANDFVWFTDQRAAPTITPVAGTGGAWERFGAKSLYMAWFDSLNQPPVAAKWQGSGVMKAAEKDGSSIAIVFSDGRPPFHIPVKLKSGEGGRMIQGLGFSPTGDYIVVKGYSHGGGIADWEILGTDVGMQLFPVVFPRERNEEIPLVPFYEEARIDGLHAVGWSKDGKFLALATEGSTPDGPRTGPYADLWLNKFLPAPDGEGFRDVFLVPIVFCDQPVPEWFFGAVHELIGIRQSGNGQFDVLPATVGKLSKLAEDHSADPYGIWLKARLTAP